VKIVPPTVSDADSEINDPPTKTIGNMEGTKQEAFNSGYDSEGDEPPPTTQKRRVTTGRRDATW
jgi:hypothetical protein